MQLARINPKYAKDMVEEKGQKVIYGKANSFVWYIEHVITILKRPYRYDRRVEAWQRQRWVYLEPV